MTLAPNLATRYSPSRSAALQPEILAALAADAWMNVAAICARLNRPSDDVPVRYCLKLMVYADLIERKIEPLAQSRTGFTYLYRRKPS
jgi:predicted transcriptional regulator